MRLLGFALLFLLLAVLLHQFLPWYAIAIAGFAAAIIFTPRSSWLAFVLPLLLGALVWGGYAYYLDQLNDSLLAIRLGETFGGISPLNLVQLTALLGGIYGGLGALTAFYLRQALRTAQ
ncbi:MAG: hypothetical protein KDC54_15830 [Lewinella sp.]|nr:hypothetical protein [Lewinella sp.]